MRVEIYSSICDRFSRTKPLIFQNIDLLVNTILLNNCKLTLDFQRIDSTRALSAETFVYCCEVSLYM